MTLYNKASKRVGSIPHILKVFRHDTEITMAIATALCKCKKCGNIFEVKAKKRNCSEAESWKKWAESHFIVCEGCFEAEQKAKAVELASNAAQIGMAALKGTEKQVVWGEQIRAELMEKANRILEEMKSKIAGLPPEAKKTNEQQLVQAIRGINIIYKEQSSASET